MIHEAGKSRQTKLINSLVVEYLQKNQKDFFFFYLTAILMEQCDEDVV